MISLSEIIFKLLQENNSESGSSEDEQQELPHECSFCGAIFYISNEFKLHIKEHGKIEKLFFKSNLCDFEGCNKAFSRTSDFKKHKVIFKK